MKNEHVIEKFINGSKWISSYTKNLKIESNTLINYSTAIAEFTNHGLIVNVTKYSVTTSKIQNMLIRELKRLGMQYNTIDSIREGQQSLLSEYEHRIAQIA